MTTLADFLLARIAEDEAIGQFPVAAGHVIAPRSRVLVECEAKRRIVDLHGMDGEYPAGSLAFHHIIKDGTHYSGGIVPGCRVCVEHHADMDCANEEFPCPTLRLLALPYADHADYRSEWRP